ncbi:MAG: DUF1501 domain-containing protein [Candidatus Binatia bacterium]
MAITRRQFIRRSGLATAGALFGPRLFGSPWLQQAAASTIGDRYLVVLFLDGGNDGLNTITPVSGALRPHYETARKANSGGIRLGGDLLVPASSFSDPNTGSQLGFHPGLGGMPSGPGAGGLAAMYDADMVAVLQGCGYPEYTLSHEVSRSIWETGSPFSGAGTGWMGRYLAASGYTGSDIPAVGIGGSVPGEFLQTATSVLSFDRVRDFGFPYDTWYDDDDSPDDTAVKNAVFSSLCASATANPHPMMQYLGTTGSSTLLASNSYPGLHQLYRDDREAWDGMYSGDNGLSTSTARGFREIAKVIYGVAQGVPNVNARFFQVTNGGYDTHSDQGGGDPEGQHFLLHREVSAAIKLFYDDLADMASGAPGGSGLANLPDKVCVMVWSEFSRRIPQNENGTDHGSQGPMFVIGGGVNAGVYGNHPNISPAAIEDDGNGNTEYKQTGSYRSTDFRDVYGTVMKHWLNLPSPGLLLPLDVGPASDYWTVPNFDLPLFL